MSMTQSLRFWLRFYGDKTHRSIVDTEARFMRKGDGKPARTAGEVGCLLYTEKPRINRERWSVAQPTHQQKGHDEGFRRAKI